MRMPASRDRARLGQSQVDSQWLAVDCRQNPINTSGDGETMEDLRGHDGGRWWSVGGKGGKVAQTDKQVASLRVPVEWRASTCHQTDLTVTTIL